MVEAAKLDDTPEQTEPVSVGIDGRRTPRERVLEAMIVVVDCDADDAIAYRRAWERFRQAAREWIVAAPGATCEVCGEEFHPDRHRPNRPARICRNPECRREAARRAAASRWKAMRPSMNGPSGPGAR